MLVENQARYLLNDVLSLHCDYVSSNGTAFHELCGCGITYPAVTKQTIKKSTENCGEEVQLPLALANDLKSVYNDRIFYDTEICTATQTFPAHRFILSARSPVFRRMFSCDMKENQSGHIDIVDLEDYTLHRMLLYIYTDTLEDLQLDDVCKLYTAADKYEIESLSLRCSSFLKDNLSPTKACDILVLSDLHHDNNLKCAVQDYILKHDKEVFGLQVWQDFMDSYPKLAADIMYRKVFPK